MKSFLRLGLILAGLWFAQIALPSTAEAASRFWVPNVVSGAVSGTGGVCRLTLSLGTTGYLAGATVIVSGVTGATGCNVTTTVSTVVDSTHIELAGTTFGGVYASGGVVAGGLWNASNTASWATTSGGSGGASVPGSADNPTFDGNSGGGTVTVGAAYSPSITTLTLSGFTGALDFSVNNNNISIGAALSVTQSASCTFNMGSGTWTFSGTNSSINFVTVSGLTLVGNNAAIIFSSGTMAGQRITLNAQHLGSVTFSAMTANMFPALINPTGGGTIDTLNISAPFWLEITGGQTLTLTNPFSFSGTSASPILVLTDGTGSGANKGTISVASGNPTMSWATIGGMAFTGGATFTANSSVSLGDNSGITITQPSSGGGRCIGC